jgi:hypothetical protein
MIRVLTNNLLPIGNEKIQIIQTKQKKENGDRHNRKTPLPGSESSRTNRVDKKKITPARTKSSDLYHIQK